MASTACTSTSTWSTTTASRPAQARRWSWSPAGPEPEAGPEVQRPAGGVLGEHPGLTGGPTVTVSRPTAPSHGNIQREGRICVHQQREVRLETKLVAHDVHHEIPHPFRPPTGEKYGEEADHEDD